jgi:hypothetical protein
MRWRQLAPGLLPVAAMRFRPSLAWSIALLTACGSSSSHNGADGGGPDGVAADTQPMLPDGACTTCGPLVMFFFDQNKHQIIRLSDVNQDGDFNDAGEATVFFNNASPPLGTYNSQGLLALGPSELLATDNVTDDGTTNTDADVVHLIDNNGDGDSLDAGEATMWFAGTLPASAGGSKITFPTALMRGPDGASTSSTICSTTSPRKRSSGSRTSTTMAWWRETER